MRRDIRRYFSAEALAHLRYVPLIMIKIRNWMKFLLNYTELKNESGIYTFRNGIKFKTEENVDVATIAVIFLKKDYGNIKRNSTVIDIGANIGVFSVYAGLRNCKVYAYEPMPNTFMVLMFLPKVSSFEIL